MELETINAGEAEIAYELSGPSGAPVVLLSHCFCADHRSWDAHMPACNSFQVLRYDARGHGESSGTDTPIDYQWHEQANDLWAIADACAPGRQVILGGASMGAAVSLHAALM